MRREMKYDDDGKDDHDDRLISQYHGGSGMCGDGIGYAFDDEQAGKKNE